MLGICALWHWPWIYNLGSRSWHTLVSWTNLCEIWSWSNLAVRIEGLDTDFWYVCTMTLTYEIWPWSRSWHTLGPRTTIVWNIIQIQLCSEESCSGHRLWECVHCDLGLWYMTLGKVMTHRWVMDNNCVKYYHDPTWWWGVMARKRILGMCALWPWPWRYDLWWISWHTLGSWTTIVWSKNKNRESTKGCSKWIVRKKYTFRKRIGLNK